MQENIRRESNMKTGRLERLQKSPQKTSAENKLN
jgi:hypothetical protein